MVNNNQSNKNKKTKDENAYQSALIKKAEEMRIPFLKAAPSQIKKEVLYLINRELAKKYNMVVFEKQGNLVKVAMTDPRNIEALNALRFLAEKKKLEVEVYLTSKEVVQDILDQYETTERAVENVLKSFQLENEKKKRKIKDNVNDEYNEILQDAPVSKLVKVIVSHAVEGRASDIHIEPVGKEYKVRFRIDGILHTSLVLPREVGLAVVSRIKILSNLKIDEKRKPQDGRFSMEWENEPIDFRVSTLPVVEGEKVVMRVLNKEGLAISVEQLGLMARNEEILTKMDESNGIILMTGPTGSGKSTTLYTLLQMIDRESKNVITLEDPVEYSIDGINQSQIKPEIGYTFATGLRSILRQDPDVIMVGEIRDNETAELAIHAALTGHLVFSTLHTNSALGAIPRLTDMGLEPFLIVSSLRVVAAQRLVRRICSHCKVKKEISSSVKNEIKRELANVSSEELKKYKINDTMLEKMEFFEGKGCEECGGTGYKGRIAVYECVKIDKKMENKILEGANENELEITAREQGFISMRQDGILKTLLGLTTLSEVERVTKGSMSVGGDVDDDVG